jgi:hypothetical protein
MSRGRRGTFAAAFRLSGEEQAMNDQDERGTGHPLPQSAEAKTDRIPEHLLHEKGVGEDEGEAVQPAGDPVNPDGEAYALKRDQKAHQDRGQSWIEKEDGDG